MPLNPRIQSLMLTALLGAGGLASAPACAADAPDWYAAITLGPTRETFNCEDTLRCDRTGSSVRLTLGRQVHDRFSVQGSYIRSQGTGAEVDLGLAAPGRGRLTSSGWEIAGLAHSGQVNGFSGYVKLGLASMTSRGTLELPGLGSSTVSQRKATPVLGVGLLYQVAPPLKLLAGYDWRRLTLDGDKQTQGAWVLGAQFSF
jgi:hypothetical protein